MLVAPGSRRRGGFATMKKDMGIIAWWMHDLLFLA
jgi:hypothetical protein